MAFTSAAEYAGALPPPLLAPPKTETPNSEGSVLAR
jgi:hypothetical protein